MIFEIINVLAASGGGVLLLFVGISSYFIITPTIIQCLKRKEPSTSKVVIKQPPEVSVGQRVEYTTTVVDDGNGTAYTSATSDGNENTGSDGDEKNIDVAKCAANARQEAEKWVKRALEKGIQGLLEEFVVLQSYVPPDMTTKAFEANWDAGRNRYKNVPCQDKGRVILKWSGQTHDYIHANYVATPINNKRFICTQGPLDATTIDFWHMVLQEETDSIIMLTNVKEKGMDKCAQYYPLEEKEVKIYGDVKVTNTVVRTLNAEAPNIRLSILNVQWKEDGKECTKEVRHYQWIDWPDHGVPTCHLTGLVLLSHVRGTNKPIVVHCSAGIGRTGSIVAIELCLERLQAGLPSEAMDELLKELRSQRPFSIQTHLQYLYIHRVMLFYFFEKYKVAVNEELQLKYKKFIEDYNKAVTNLP